MKQFVCAVFFVFFVNFAFISSISASAIDQAATEEPLKNSVLAAEKWLHELDRTKYEETWNSAALTLRLTVPKQRWIQLQEAVRKPFGSLISRKIVDQRTAQNPVGLPKGNYMVLVFNSSFSQRAAANELVTLVQESDGQWRVLTYQIQ